MQKVAIISTGGTIASTGDLRHGGVRVGTTSHRFLDLAAERLPGVNLVASDFAAVGSYMMTLQQIFDLAGEANHWLARPEISGVVVTHGTDTLEESAFMADLLLEGDKPVVFTGAQRSADHPEGDGPSNFLDAVRVAADAQSRGMGALVAFEQEIHAARDVTKTHTSRTGTFQSAEHGKLGEVDGDRVIYHRSPRQRLRLSAAGIETRVDLIKLAAGADGRLIDFAVQSGSRGLVIEAFGRGNVTPAVLESLERAVAAEVTVAISSRCPMGRVAPIYAGSGGAGLARLRVHFAGDLSAIKTRLLLCLLLANQTPAKQVAAYLEQVAT